MTISIKYWIGFSIGILVIIGILCLIYIDTSDDNANNSFIECTNKMQEVIDARTKCDLIENSNEYNDCINKNPWTLTYADCAELKK